jgi:hypothetical protein
MSRLNLCSEFRETTLTLNAELSFVHAERFRTAAGVCYGLTNFFSGDHHGLTFSGDVSC